MMTMNAHDLTEQSPLTSIIIITRNGLSFTKECITSIFQHTKENFELVLIDNGSTDGTLEFLQTVPRARIISNKENKGFPGGCNQGLRIARGENIVLLNNDTVVTKDWLKRLIWSLNNHYSCGIIGPRSNFILPHQSIPQLSYKTMDQMHEFANEWSQKNEMKSYEVDNLSGVCMIFKRDLIDKIGGLDERFSPGYYEDTDFCIRALIYGTRLLVANDVFIHHYGSSSFKIDRIWQKKMIHQSEKKFFTKWSMTHLNEIRKVVARERPFSRERHYVPF
ncbi:GT2 family glycosyltransferase [Oikeobacillus pervagus]|uniref:GT2 family glycosyltransferase n=2 Tax=Oikeobacillus pervagus TaxID=1325931 RepID=A0AAJ1WIB1_9BACI|nr:GT2 family glycosyltransferase [Oikeobacillus pervagus]